MYAEPSEDDPMDVDDRVSSSREAGTSGRQPPDSSGFSRRAANGIASRAAATPHGVRGSGNAQRLPMLASACPGWVCYAEKTHGDYVLPHISATKSPQVSESTVLLGTFHKFLQCIG